MKKLFTIGLLCGLALSLNAQLKPIVTKAKYFKKTPPLKEITRIEPIVRDSSWKGNDGKSKLEFPGSNAEYRNTGPDPVWQNSFGKQKHDGPIHNFDGTTNVNNVLPPDTEGDVGPNHFFQMVNNSFQIFDKEGNSLYGPADNSTLWEGFIGPWSWLNNSDPIIVYDELADRWIASQMAYGATYWELVAVSTTPDPLGSWSCYAFEYPVLNDYPKLSVWPDAYYCSFNLFGDYIRAGVSAYEREAMLAGDSIAYHVFFDLPQELASWALLPANFDGTPPEDGTPSYWTCFTDDGASWWTEDLIRIWEFNVDWDSPENSTFEEVQNLNTEPFNYPLCDAGPDQYCIPQPEGAPKLDALSIFSMQPLQYRNFGTYETMVFNHTVNADGNGLAGIRWYELRKENDDDGWYIYQQGTYAPDNDYRWMGSIAMDARGYIALGYTVSSYSTYPSLRYTGRSPDAPLGEMTFVEEEIIKGTGSQSSSDQRWGDYSMMAVDPSNDTTFWYTGEYMQTSSGRDWKTRIVAFNLSIDEIPPTAIADLQTQNTTTNAVVLNWTATGNDGTEGTAYYYDIRYKSEPINEDNWDSSIIVENKISPAESGTAETFIVDGLAYNADYYFAMKTIDKQNNISGISNSPSANVEGPPQIVLMESEVNVKVFEPVIIQRSFIISNTGETDINYKLLKENIFKPENEGQVLDTLENRASFNNGMTWADGYLYMIEWVGNYLFKYDTSLQMKVDSFNIHSQSSGLCWDGTYFRIGDKEGVIHAYYPNGNPAGISFPCPFSEPPALTYSGNHFIVSKKQPYPTIYFLDQYGNEIKKYHTKVQNAPQQFSWADNHYNSNLWYIDKKDTIGQLSFSGDTAFRSIAFESPGNIPVSIAHDGKDLWLVEKFQSLYRIDDGIDEISWFSAEPTEGTIYSEELAEINLQADLTALPETDTSTILIINSNDPLNNSVIMPFNIYYSIVDIGADTILCSNLNKLLDAGEGYKEYLWLDGSIEQTLLIDSTGYGLGTFAIWVEAMDYGGGTFRDTTLITFKDCTGIEEFENTFFVSVIPNPFNQTTMLTYKLAEPAMVEVVLYNAMGALIKKVVDENQTAGKKNIKIDLSNMPDAVYYIHLLINDRKIVKKVMKM